jgi:putative protease
VQEANEDAAGVIRGTELDFNQAMGESGLTACGDQQRHPLADRVWMIEEGERPGELMPVLEDEHGTYIMNSKDLRAVEHVARLAEIGVDSLKIEGRTKSAYYVVRTAQIYRQAIDDVVAGRSFNPAHLSALENLANRGYTDGFYQRHHTVEYQNYLTGQSESARQMYVGDIVAYDPARKMAKVVVKNRFAVGDRLELIHPAGNREMVLEQIFNQKGTPITEAPGSGWVVHIPLSDNVDGAMLARFL